VNRTYVTVTTAAKRLGVCAETIRRWIRSGKIPAVRLPSQQVRISSVVIENILATPATPYNKRHIH
jgi:excisionase family DNA binding protein